MSSPRLGVNIDHIATLRQLRGTPYPNLLQAASLVEKAGAKLITVHLREDRRHIQDRDVVELKEKLKIPLNLEMALSEGIIKFCLKIKPAWACLVPEKRTEVTTEGGLDVKKNQKRLESVTLKLKKAGIRVSYFIEPTSQAVKLSAELGADAVEIHTGKYGIATQKKKMESTIQNEINRIKSAASRAKEMGIGAHAGHGLDYENVKRLASLQIFEEFNIGHSIVCRAVEVGIERAIREMLSSLEAP